MLKKLLLISLLLLLLLKLFKQLFASSSLINSTFVFVDVKFPFVIIVVVFF